MKSRLLVLACFTIAAILCGGWFGFGGVAVALPTATVATGNAPISVIIEPGPQSTPQISIERVGGPAENAPFNESDGNSAPPPPSEAPPVGRNILQTLLDAAKTWPVRRVPQLPAEPPPAEIDFSSLERFDNPAAAVGPAVDPAIAALVSSVSAERLSGYVQALEGFGTRHSLSDSGRPDYGVGAARNWIRDEFERVGAGRLQVRLQDFEMSANGRTSLQQNVIAILPGVGAHPSVMALVAHYDSRNLDPLDHFSLAPGANDNASGVALLLESARLLSSRSWNQTIVFIAFAAEEQDTQGSAHYVQTALQDGMQFDAVINNDIVGGHPGIPRSIRLFAPGPDNSPSSEVARYLAYVGRLYMPSFVVDIHPALDREGRWGDHKEFIKAGIGAVRLTESVEDATLQHNGRDTADRLDYDYLAGVTALNVAAAAEYAGAPACPAAPSVTRMAEPGAFTLSWPADPAAAGYALSFREAGALYYPNLQFVLSAQAGHVVVFGLDPGKQYYLSVSALDQNGRLSFFSQEVLIDSAGP